MIGKILSDGKKKGIFIIKDIEITAQVIIIALKVFEFPLMIEGNNIDTDFGMMGRVNRKTRRNFVSLFMAIEHRYESKTADSLLKLTDWEKEPDRIVLEREVAGFIDQHFFLSLKELDIGKLLSDLLEITSRHRLRLHTDLFMMIKALTTVHGVGRSLDPDFDITEHAAPFYAVSD